MLREVSNDLEYESVLFGTITDTIDLTQFTVCEKMTNIKRSITLIVVLFLYLFDIMIFR